MKDRDWGKRYVYDRLADFAWEMLWQGMSLGNIGEGWIMDMPNLDNETVVIVGDRR